MKQYFFEADKTQHEKPTEPKYVFCPPARVRVCAETEAEALALAEKEFARQYAGTGILLGTIRMIETRELPVDWSYGYGDERSSGTAEDREALQQACTK